MRPCCGFAAAIVFFILAVPAGADPGDPLVEADAAIRKIMESGVIRTRENPEVFHTNTQTAPDYCAAARWQGQEGAPVYGFKIYCKGNHEYIYTRNKWCWGIRTPFEECIGELTNELERMMRDKGYVKLAAFRRGNRDPRYYVFGASAGQPSSSDRFCMAFSHYSHSLNSVSYRLECSEPPTMTLHDLDQGEDVSGISRFVAERGYALADVFYFSGGQRPERDIYSRAILFRKP